MPSEEVTDDVSQIADDVAHFQTQPFWKRVAVLSAGLGYLVATRLLLPTVVAWIVLKLTGLL